MKFLKIINLVLLFLFSYSFANAKPLPPGTGNVIPANILFLIDRSQSMNTSASGNEPTKMNRPPVDVVARGDGSGDYFVSTLSDGGFYVFNADQNKITTNHFQGQKVAYGLQSAGLSNPVQMEYHKGTNKLYVLADQRKGEIDFREHDRVGQFLNGGFVVYAIDPTKRGPSKINAQKYWNQGKGSAYLSKRAKDLSTTFKTGNGFWVVNPQRNFKKHLHDGHNRIALSMTGNSSMSLHGDKLYIVTSGVRSKVSQLNDENGGMLVVNINNQTYPNWKGVFHCKVGRTWADRDKKKIYGYFNEAIDVVTEGSKTVIYAKTLNSIYRAELEDDGCIPNLDSDVSAFTPIVENDPCGEGKGSSIVVKDKKIYTTGYYTNTVCKHEVTSTSKFGGTAKFVKKAGVRDATRLNSADLGDIYLLKPMGIDFGKSTANPDHENTLFVTSMGRSEITMMDESFNYKDHFGDPGISRFTGVQEAIRFILNDSATTQQADFGLALWSGVKNKFTGFHVVNNEIDYTRYSDGLGCSMNERGSSQHTEACLEVGVNPKGAQQILSLFDKEEITLNYQTKSTGFSLLLDQYFNRQTWPANPMEPGKKDCQTTAIILIGDGRFKDLRGGGINNGTINKIKQLYDRHGIITYAVGYGSSITNDAKDDFEKIATAGHTDDLTNPNSKAYYPQTPEALKKVTDTIVQEILTQSVVYSSPAISAEVKKSGELYQAKFTNRSNQEWFGSIIKTDLEPDDGDAETEIWKAHQKMPKPDNRKIWTALPGNQEINNFKISNVSAINDLFELQGNILTDYWDDSTNINGHCPGVGKEGIPGDEDEGLIEFVRGKDYFDYNGDCNISAEKIAKNDDGVEETWYMSDIYNSSLLILGPPGGDYSDYNNRTEGYFRSKKNYGEFVKNNANRPEVIYAAANNGILHAISTQKTGGWEAGEEIWGFIPPLIVPKLPLIINQSLNTAGKGGGSIPKFLLDGSPVVHDTYFDHPSENKPLNWYTLLMIPYGRAGAGFSVLDITDVKNPNHVYSILNDASSKSIYKVDHTGKVDKFSYNTNLIRETFFEEIKKAVTNSSDTSKPDTCNESDNTSCYSGKKLTLKGIVLDDRTKVNISINGKYDQNFTLSNDGVNTTIILSEKITHNASGAEGAVTDNISVVEIGEIDPAGVDYDYRFLGETWGSPRVFRMPSGPGDNDVINDEYVAVLTGGYGNGMPSIGSSVYVIDWTTGKIKKNISIIDKDNDIVNSIPAGPVVITADAAQEAYTGALVYVNDIEGKITKINLTNMQGSYSYNQTTGAVTQIPPTGTANSGIISQDIKLYDHYTFFDLEASTDNNRYMYHSMEAGKGVKSKKFWLYGATGDYMNLNDKQVLPTKVKNVIFGVKDHLFPGFGNINSTPDKLAECKDMTGTDETSSTCADTGDRGWYKNLEDRKKVTAEPTLANNVVYFPIFKPNTALGCGKGDAYICAVDADCGYNRSSELDESGSTNKKNCYKVGTGVLSKLVIFGKKLYANISGETEEDKKKKDIVILNAIDTGDVNLRSSWRENF